MALKTFNPVTPSLRQLVIVDRSALYKGKPVKALTEGLSKSGGRNNTGRITARFIGGGHKRTYRVVDFKRRKVDVAATVERLEYDPQPVGVHRSRSLCGRRAGLHPGASASGGRRHGDLRRQRRRQARQRHADRQHPRRYDRPQRGDQAGQGWPESRARPVPTLRSSAATRVTSSCV